ncbi:MAG: MATE family efflux transporter [Bacteroidaceae bacterium]|nr:MATE family efflux transporter [Bacteroidaceae bacterium]
MTVGRPFPLILNFALPLLLGNLLIQAYSLVDVAIVGQTIGLNALAGVGASSSVLFLILGFCVGLTGGFGIPVAQAFGAHDYARMRRYVKASYLLSVFFAVLLSIACSLLCDEILRWMQTPEEIFNDAYIYLFITFVTIPCNLAYNLLASMIRALGDSKTPFCFLLIGSVLNIGLDFLLILVFHMGVAGAAVATAIAQTVSFLLCAIHMNKAFPILKSPSSSAERVLWRDAWFVLSIGVPMGLQFSITAIGSIMLQSANNALGTMYATAFTAAMRIKMFAICPYENLGVALATYCGQNLGAKKFDRIRAGLKDAIYIMLAYSLIAFFVVWFFAHDLSTLFIAEDETVLLDHSVLFLRTSCCCYAFLGILTIFRYSLQGVGRAKLSIGSGVSELLARGLVSLFLVPVAGFFGVCVGDPFAWIAADCFLVPAFFLVIRKLEK